MYSTIYDNMSIMKNVLSKKGQGKGKLENTFALSLFSKKLIVGTITIRLTRVHEQVNVP